MEPRQNRGFACIEGTATISRKSRQNCSQRLWRHVDSKPEKNPTAFSSTESLPSLSEHRPKRKGRKEIYHQKRTGKQPHPGSKQSFRKSTHEREDPQKRTGGGGPSRKSGPGLLRPADVLPRGGRGVTFQGRARGRTCGASSVPGTLQDIGTDTLNECMKF